MEMREPVEIGFRLIKEARAIELTFAPPYPRQLWYIAKRRGGRVRYRHSITGAWGDWEAAPLSIHIHHDKATKEMTWS